MRYITFALAKGRLAKKAMALLEEIGITCDEMKDEKTRKLIFVNEELKLKFFLSKASDVPTYVEYGAADIGVVGKDTILEEGRNLWHGFKINKSGDYVIFIENYGEKDVDISGYCSVNPYITKEEDKKFEESNN